MALVERVKGILLKPQEEWQTIVPETTDVKTLYTTYIIILAAIPAVAGFLSIAAFSSILGRFGGGFGIGFGLVSSIIGYLIGLAMVYVIALIADVLAPSFDGEKNFAQSFKLVTYSMTASWVGGIFSIIPLLGGLISLLCSAYGIYILYLGVVPMKKVPEAKAVGYTVVVIISAIVLMFMISFITGAVMAMGMVGSALPLR